MTHNQTIQFYLHLHQLTLAIYTTGFQIVHSSFKEYDSDSCQRHQSKLKKLTAQRINILFSTGRTAFVKQPLENRYRKGIVLEINSKRSL